MQAEAQTTALPHLAETFLRPAQPRLKEALSCAVSHRLYEADLSWELSRLEGTRDGRQTWERLAARGVIPIEWVDAPHRWFRWQQKRHDPRDSKQAVTLAASVLQVITAEALAWEAAARLHRLGLPMPTKILWRHAEDPPHQPAIYQPWQGLYQLLFEGQVSSFRALDQEAQLRELAARHLYELRLFGGRHPLLRDLLFVSYVERLWELASVSGWLVSDSPALFLDQTRFIPRRLVGRPIACLPNPLTPLLDLWRLGFGCAGFVRSCIVLLTP